jgi:hypothetical protein
LSCFDLTHRGFFSWLIMSCVAQGQYCLFFAGNLAFSSPHPDVVSER